MCRRHATAAASARVALLILLLLATLSCQAPAGSPRVSLCPEGFTACAGRCYALQLTSFNYEAAKRRCAELGSTLAIPRTHAENLCVASLSGGQHVWLGVTDRQTEGVFLAQDGTPLAELDGYRWEARQPDNFRLFNLIGGEDCVEMSSPLSFRFAWNDENCESHLLSMCQLQGTYHPPTRSPSTRSPLTAISSHLPESCGTRFIEDFGFFDRPFRVTNSAPVETLNYPWQVQIKTRSEHVCGGIIITNQHILTAAHCLTRHHERDLQVVVGQNDLKKTDEEEEVFSVKAKYSYLDFDTKDGAGHYSNDIAVLLLQTSWRGPIRFGDHVRPVCLSADDLAEEFPTCFVSGWGRISNGSFPTLLHGTEIPLVSSDYCASPEVWGDTFNGTIMLCAGDAGGGSDACAGDSGGPLVCQDNQTGHWIATGIVSWGSDDCGQTRRVGVYTRVSAYVDWITKVLDFSNISG